MSVEELLSHSDLLLQIFEDRVSHNTIELLEGKRNVDDLNFGGNTIDTLCYLFKNRDDPGLLKSIVNQLQQYEDQSNLSNISFCRAQNSVTHCLKKCSNILKIAIVFFKKTKIVLKLGISHIIFERQLRIRHRKNLILKN